MSSYSSVVALQQEGLFVRSPVWFFCSKKEPLEISIRGQTWPMVQQKMGSGSCMNWVLCMSLFMIVSNTLSLHMLIQLNDGIKLFYSICSLCTFIPSEKDSSKNNYPCDVKPKVLNTDDKSKSNQLSWILVLWFGNCYGNISPLFYHLSTVWSLEHSAAFCLLC